METAGALVGHIRGWPLAMGDTDIRFYLSIFWRRLPLMLAIVSLLTGLALAAAYLMPSVYSASAKILAEPPQIPAEMVPPTVQVGALEQLQIIEQEITTRENLLDLATRMDIYGDRRAMLSDADVVENLRSRTTLQQVDPSGGEGATIFSVSFTARDPDLAARVVNELVTFILQKNVGLRTGKAEDTLQFFDKEVTRLGANLAALDAQVLDFRNANKDALPDSIEFRRTQQSNQQERLLLLEREESSLRVRRDNLVRMFQATGQMTGTGPVSPEQQMLLDLKRALSEQLSIFAEDSPNVVALRKRIADLQKRLQAGQASAQADRGPSELDLQLSEIDERLAFIGEEKTAIARYVADLTRSIDATPENETRLNALERSRANIQAQYNAAVAKLAEASTGEQIEIRSKGGSFSIVELATPPEDRVSPNRKRIAAAGLAGGIFLALGLVVALELINRSIRRPVDISRMLEKPLLATVPYIWLPEERRARKRRMAVGFATAASVAVVLAVTVQQYRLPLSSALENFVLNIAPSRMM